MYNKKVMQYFMHPKNAGKIKNADGIGKVGNIQCGDIMRIFIKVGKNKKGEEFIKNIKFETLGCPAAIATSSVATELAKGKTIKEALKITNKDVIKVLGELPPIKYHCSLLAEQALSEAIYDYFKKQKRKIPKELEKKHKQMLTLEKKFHEKFNS
ncbi:MAG: iron-sulfur cluster assembly scaffold protein [Candidatus Pacearchaeota archaeon]